MSAYNPNLSDGKGGAVRPATNPESLSRMGSGRQSPLRPSTSLDPLGRMSNRSAQSSAAGGNGQRFSQQASGYFPPQAPVEQEPADEGGNSEEWFNGLIQDLNHVIWEVRRNAAEDLGGYGDQRAVPYLIQHLSDTVGGVRFAIVEALGKMGDSRAVPALVQLLDDPSFGAYGPVIEALANMKSEQAIPYFIRFLRDGDPRIRGLAHNSLMVMTRQFIPFKSKGTDEEREKAVQQWEAWWNQNYQTFQLPG